MRTVYSRFLFFLLGIFVAGTIAQAQTIQSIYTTTTSPYTYVPVSASNSSTFYDLKTVGLFPSGTGAVYGNLDDGDALLGAFGLPTTLTLPMNVGLNSDVVAAAATAGSNGYFQFPRLTPTGGATVFVGGTTFGSPSAFGYYGNSTPYANLVFGFGADLDVNPATAGWYYAIQGTAPNRRIVIEWRNVSIKGSSATVTFQIIINETKEIDIVYGSYTGTIPVGAFYTGINEGIGPNTAAGFTAKALAGQNGNYIASRFINGAWESSSNVTSPYGTSGVFPTQNIRYCLTPKIDAAPANATLFDAVNNASDRLNLGATLTKQYTVLNPSTSNAPIKITAQISGVSASAYSVSPAIVPSLAPGSSQTFDVTFTANAFGDLNASMTVNVSTVDGATCPLTKTPAVVQLKGRGVGLTAQITPLTADFGSVGVGAVSSQNFVLFKNDASIPLIYYFQGPITGSSQFAIIGASGTPKTLSGTVNPGASVFLPAQFSPTINGPQSATLNFYYTNQAGTARSVDQTISLAGQGTPSRLKLAREGETVHFSSGSVYAQSKFGDVGEQNLAFNFTISNTGVTAPIHLQNFKFYTLDVDNPVNNRFRVMWSGGSFGKGAPISSNDFTVQQLIAGQYVTVGPSDVVTATAGASVPMRIVFTPARRGTKFVRMFFNTDATTDENFSAISSLNVSDVATAGLQSYDFYGITARNSQIAMIPGLLFGQVSLGDSAMGNIAVKNVGDSRLLVESSTLKLLPGDADFSIESVFPAAVQDNGRYVIPIGSTATITVKFKPRAGGTRQSTLYFVSNDSSDIGEVGHRYISLVGEGLATTAISVGSLEGIPVFNQDTAVVDDPSSYVTKTIDISNIGKNEVLLKDVVLEGVDKDSYKILSKVTGKLSVGSVGEVTVQFAPKSGGGKSAQLVVKSNAQAGDEIVALTGFAGVRTIGALTANAFGTDSVIVNEGVNQTIIVKNTGTVNLDVSTLSVNGTNKDDYHLVGTAPGAVSPGGTVNIEVELKSGTLGAKSAELIFGNNSTNAPALSVALNGYVGTRSYTVNPEQFSISTSKGNDGQYAEKGGCVEVKNTGDISMKITDVQLTGAGADQFVLGTAPSGLIGPGEAVQVCFTYKPTSDAVVQATLTVTTNGETSQVQILLNGTATGVSETGEVSGYMVSLHPNPVMSGKAEIVYRIGVSENVRIEVYTMVGERVAVIDAGMVSAGDHRVEIGAEDLPSGTYYYRLVTPHFVRSHTFQIIK